MLATDLGCKRIHVPGNLLVCDPRNVSAKDMHEKYEALLSNYDVSEKVLSDFETVIRRMMYSYSEESKKESAALKRKISEINSTIREVKLRFASGKIDEDISSTAIQEYTERKDVLLLELEKWQVDTSNQNEMIPMVVATASKIGTLWKEGDLERKKKIQKLVFPEGIFWDKKKRAFLTKKRNAVF